MKECVKDSLYGVWDEIYDKMKKQINHKVKAQVDGQVRNGVWSQVGRHVRSGILSQIVSAGLNKMPKQLNQTD